MNGKRFQKYPFLRIKLITVYGGNSDFFRSISQMNKSRRNLKNKIEEISLIELSNTNKNTILEVEKLVNNLKLIKNSILMKLPKKIDSILLIFLIIPST